MRQSRETLIGAAVLIVGAAFMVIAFAGSGSRSDGYPVIARFDQVDGISVGSEVRISGVPVGEVSALGIEPSTRKAVVTMMIDDDVKLPIDTGALIVQVGLLGSKFIKLDPGGEEDMIAPGEEIDFVQDAVIIIELLQKMVDDVENKRRAKDKADPGIEAGRANGKS